MPSRCFLSSLSRNLIRTRRGRFESSTTFETSPPDHSRSEYCRVVMAGHCRTLISAGVYSLGCPCPNGEYSIPLNTPSNSGFINCTRCTHPLSQHENAASLNPQSPEADHQIFFNAPHQGNPLKLIIPPTFTARADTVSSLWHRIKKVQLLHVRGTPASGKSTLANFLKIHVTNTEPDMHVRSVTWTDDIRGCDTHTSYHRLLNTLTGRPIDLDDWLFKKCLLIIDEAQASYQFTSLWNDLIKLIEPGYGIFIVLFSSYGSPSRGSLEAKTQTPVYFKPSQRVGIKRTTSNPNLCIFFSRSEFDEVVDRVCKSYSDGQRFRPSEDLVDYIWLLTNGHPSAVQAVLAELAETSVLRKFRKESLEISLSHAIDYMISDYFLRRMIETTKFGRGLPPSDFLQRRPDVVRFLKEAVVLTHVEGAADPGTPLEVCYKQGWMQAELSADGDEPSNTVYVFPSNLHKRCVELMVPRPDTPFPSEIYPTVKSLAFAAIRRFSVTALKTEKPGPGAVPRPLEASFQDEFYKSCYKILGNSYLTPEWSGPTVKGWVDFHVKTQGWVVECMRDGNKLGEHISRFQPGGRYYAGIRSGEITDCILLDFRRSKPGMARSNVNWFYYVVFTADFSEYTIYNSKGEVEPGEKCIGLLE